MMKMNMKKTLMMLLVTATTPSWIHAGTIDVGSQFTYQGELTDNGSPASGSYDFNIELRNSATGGQILDADIIDDVEVSNGLFNLVLNFGDAPFNGDEVFLQISVRPGNSSGLFEALVPRQRINVTPYAIQAEFTENGQSPWSENGSGLIYDSDVIIGNAGTSTSSLLTIDTTGGESPLRAKINGATRLIVRDNGGTSLGVNTTAPTNGLRVEGDANQQINSHGFVKAATNIECGAGLNGGSISFFNNVNGNDFTSTQNGAAGGCVITVPFDISNAFFTVSAHDIGGVGVFETVVASCSATSSTEIQCQLQKIGANTSVNNGVVQLTFY